MPVYLKNDFSKKHIIFIHIPKTGGRYLHRILAKSLQVKKLMIEPKLQPHTFGHYTCDNIIKILNNNSCLFNSQEYFVFTFIRNPFDRILSSYLAYTINNTPDFSDYIKMVEEVVKNELYLSHGKINTNDLSHYIPQTKMIGNNELNFIGRFEDFSNDIKQVYKKTKVKGLRNAHLRKRIVNYRDYYNSKNRRIIEDIYKDDLSKYDYLF